MMFSVWISRARDMVSARVLLSGRAPVLRRVGAAVAVVATITVAATATAVAEASSSQQHGCPALYVLGVQGTGQSSPNADPGIDSGLLGSLLAPVMSSVPELAQRSYVPYSAGFGGVVPGGGGAPYAVSVAEARHQLDAAAAEIAHTCPSTMLAGAGFSQGAHAMAQFAREVGAGIGPVPADRVAGVALYSNPSRAAGSDVFPGRPGQVVPDPAPGTAGSAVSGVHVDSPPVRGGGIAAEDATYGALTGRVADVCMAGDLACTWPDDATLLQVGAEIAAQVRFHDPIAALNSIQDLLSAVLGDTWAEVVTYDMHIGDMAVDYIPKQPLASRLVDAGNPASNPPDPALAADRWNQIISVIAAHPLELPKVAGQLSQACGQLLAHNADLVDPATWHRYGDTVARHTGYAVRGQLDSGAAWLVALAHDLAGNRP